MTTSLSVGIPTNRPIDQRVWLLEDIASQTMQPDECVIVYDRYCRQAEHDDLVSRVSSVLMIKFRVITNISDPLFVPQSGVSVVRNMIFSHARSDYVVCLDDDNRIADDFLALLAPLCAPDWCLIPVEKRPDGSARSRGYRGMSRMTWIILPLREASSLSFASSNAFCVDRAFACAHPFDETMPFVYEDFCFFVQRKKYGGLTLCESISVTHHMIPKSKPADAYVHTPLRAYQKGKHRVLFARLLYSPWVFWLHCMTWLWVYTWYLSVLIFFWSGVQERRQCFCALLRGTRDGLRSNDRR